MFSLHLLIAPTLTLFSYICTSVCVCVCVISVCTSSCMCVWEAGFESQALPPTQVGLVEAPEPCLHTVLATDTDVCECLPKRLNSNELMKQWNKQINKRLHHLNLPELWAATSGLMISSDSNNYTQTQKIPSVTEKLEYQQRFSQTLTCISLQSSDSCRKQYLCHLFRARSKPLACLIVSLTPAL